jgi:hypothetical protein
MNTISLMALVIVLAFGIGFFVAALIWFISWVISPKINSKTIPGFSKLFGSIKNRSYEETQITNSGKK